MHRLRQLAYHTVCQNRPGRSRLRMCLPCNHNLNLMTHVVVDCYVEHARLLVTACVHAGRGHHVTQALESHSSWCPVQLPAVSLFPHQYKFPVAKDLLTSDARPSNSAATSLLRSSVSRLKLLCRTCMSHRHICQVQCAC